MASTLGRNLHLCFTKIKRPVAPESITADHQSRPIFIKNYNSLYDYNNFDSSAVAKAKTLPPCSSSSSSSTAASDEPDLADVFASRRFFFSSPGRSNSIIESTPSIATSSKSSDMSICVNDTVVPQVNSSQSSIMSQSSVYTSRETSSLQSNSPPVKDSVAVHTYSPDPYLDFRRSMQEMVEAQNLVDVKANWDYLHELLLCYLALNPQSTHKFILSAFADLLVSLLSSSPEKVGCRREYDCKTATHCL
ncbi:hypothetical protein K2173_018419 [Erythroxylum novogranatense]|uniref:Transcription repressor n=1 Tax=Erythroxylum novogranatense TaxID=1862640 RepID=A0AAV8UAD6_9ROSI|nr:hypothetical protein K2173_018419 [Erythroxylum novogranatense]